MCEGNLHVKFAVEGRVILLRRLEGFQLTCPIRHMLLATDAREPTVILPLERSSAVSFVLPPPE